MSTFLKSYNNKQKQATQNAKQKKKKGKDVKRWVKWENYN